MTIEVSADYLREELRNHLYSAEQWAKSDSVLMLLSALEDIGRAEECITLLHELGYNDTDSEEYELDELRAKIQEKIPETAI